MSDKSDPQELKSLLAKIMTQKPEPADTEKNQGQEPEKVIEADKILLRDGAGKSRGKISASPDGSAGLILSNDEGNAWAWLGVNQDGEAFLELKDRKGEISFKVPGDGAAADASRNKPADPVSAQAAEPAPATPDAQSVSRPDSSAMAIGAPESKPEAEQAPPAVPPDWKPAYVDTTVYDRLEELERKNQGWGFFRAAFIGLLAVILGLQVFTLMRPKAPPGNLQVKSLMVRDHNGVLRAWLGERNGNPALYLRDRQGQVRAALGLTGDGFPSLVLYDQGHRIRARLHLWPNGDPKLDLNRRSDLFGKTAVDSKKSTDNQQGMVSDPGSEDGTVAGPMGEDLAQVRDAATETYFVGSKTSNKYHFPECRWAKTIRRSHLIIFKSLADAKARGYIPCPVCKPPPLSK